MTLTVSYFAALLITLFGLGHALVNIRRPWAAPYLAVLVSFFGWYLVEPLYAPKELSYFDPQYVEAAFSIATAYLVVFIGLFFGLQRVFRPTGVPRIRSVREVLFAPGMVSPDRVALIMIGLWLLLLAYGTFRVGGDIGKALFPVDSRAGARMWQRAAGAGAGSTGFIVSTAAYLYSLALASFGILLLIVRKPRMRMLLVVVIAISWPYAFLQGSRNVTLLVVAPMFASVFLLTRLNPVVKVAILLVGFLCLEFAFRATIAMRNVGFDAALLGNIAEQQHLGLNMASELTWVVKFLNEGALDVYWGSDYFAQAANVIPRAIWPNKPMVGIDYALARGYGGGQQDIGVIATISTGNIGQGVLNFGPILGPIAAAALMAVWAIILYRFRLQGTTPRIILYVVGLALTFNLGRDVTLLVLFPFVFGYIAVRLRERFQSSKGKDGHLRSQLSRAVHRR